MLLSLACEKAELSHEPSWSVLEGLCGIFEAQVPPAL